MDTIDLLMIARARLAATGLVTPSAACGDVVSRLVAVQAQEWPLARWSVGQRTAGATDSGVAALEANGELLRTHVLRPTWHYVAPADIRALLALTGPRVQVALRSSFRRHDFDDRVRARAVDAVAGALRGGRSATRDELAAAVADAGIICDRQGLNVLLMHCEVEAVICSGPPRGRKFTYALLDDVVPAATAAAGDPAATACELAVRYFAGHGPASEKDLAWWSSLKIADVRRAIRDAGDRLASADVDGQTLWHVPGAFDAPPPAQPVLLLQTFDEYVVGFGATRHALDIAGIASMVGAEWGLNGHPVVADSQVVGHWKRAVRDEDVLVTVALRTALPAPHRDALGAAVDAYGAFLGRPAEVIVTGP